MTVGILALQGGVAEHAEMVRKAGARPKLIRKREHLTDHAGVSVDALILPGGESSTIDRLLRLFDLVDPIAELIRGGTPTLGTCAGLILLAKNVIDPAPGQQTLGLLDVAVRRNAFGAQTASTVASFDIAALAPGQSTSVTGALIRAPKICEVGPAARAIVTHGAQILGATSAESSTGGLGQITGISFHPELTGDTTFHCALVQQAQKNSRMRDARVDQSGHSREPVTV